MELNDIVREASRSLGYAAVKKQQLDTITEFLRGKDASLSHTGAMTRSPFNILNDLTLIP